MTSEMLTTLLGTVASVCTTSAFVPQIVKLYRFGGRDLSYAMLFTYWLGVALWVGYGLLIVAAEVVLSSAVSGVLVSLCLILKWRAERAGAGCRPAR